MRTYGYNAVKMSDNLTLEQLTALADNLRNDPKNANPLRAEGRSGSIWLFTKATHKRLDAIAWAVSYKLADKNNPPSPIDYRQ
jgi:hypothetical protein